MQQQQMQMQGQPMQQQQMQMQGQPMQMQQPGQQIVVIQQAPAAVEPEQKCCMCLDIGCGLTTLMVFEIIYMVIFVIFLAMVVFIGGAVAATGAAASDSGSWDNSG
jgi:hypothetical protein